MKNLKEADHAEDYSQRTGINEPAPHEAVSFFEAMAMAGEMSAAGLIEESEEEAILFAAASIMNRSGKT